MARSGRRRVQRSSRRFPRGFLWGVATSAYQIEGGATADGKGRSIWDVYAHRPGKIADGSSGDVAADHYRRYREDVALMQSLGAKAYRFSVSWPRIFPEGRGRANAKGLDFYSRLVDALLAAKITPFATLYHWDLPQALQEKGGWQSRDTAMAFADYAGFIAGRLSDRVRYFSPLNELRSFVELGHVGSEMAQVGGTVRFEHAPGLKLAPAALNQVRHHAVLAHGLGMQAIRAHARRGTRCGTAENIEVAVPLIETAEHIRAAEIATREANAPYLTVMLEGRYTDAYLEAAGRDAPQFTADELRTIATPVDFVGINVYRPSAYVLAADTSLGFRALPFSASHPRMLSPWQLLGPEALYWGPRFVQSLWKAKSIYVLENGCATEDRPAADGSIHDTDRVMFLRQNLTQLQRATAEGVPVKGYFLWSLMDNFEWNAGYTQRFGIVYVDFQTLRRIPKASAQYFRETSARNAVV